MTTIAVVVALFGEMVREWVKKPNIRLKFSPESDRCFRKAKVPSDIIQGREGRERDSQGVTTVPYSFKNVERYYYRLEIRNHGGPAKNVKVKLDILDFLKKEVEYFEPSTLNWISGKESENFARGEVNYVNICSQVISHPDIKNRLRAELFNTSPRGIIWDRPLDNYIFKITVYGDNINPIPLQFKFIKPPGNTQPGKLFQN